MFKNENRHYSLRKLSVGLASILIGISFASNMNDSSVKADTVKIGSNSVQTVKVNNTGAKDRNTAAQGSDAVVKADAKSATKEQSQIPEASKKDSSAITQDLKLNAINTKAKQKDAAIQSSDAAGNKALKANNSSAEQENISAKNDSLAAKNKALKAKAEATKKAAAAMLHVDSSETTLNLKDINTIDPKTLKENKTEATIKADPARGIDPVKFAANGGFDPKIWGTMDTSKWQLDSSGNITGYTGDMSHIIIPNASDFAKVGKSYSQIGISHYEMNKLGGGPNSKADTLAISLTDNRKVKASNTDWNTYWSYTFDGSKLKQANLEGLDTSNVTNMCYMFNNASSLTNLDVSNWDTSKVTDMSGMFNHARGLTSLDVSNWDTGKVTNMFYMFYSASSLTNLDVSNWDTGKVTDMGGMFNWDINLTSLDVSHWNTSNVTDMAYMFHRDPKLALIVNGKKFADYLAKNNFAESRIDSNVKSITTDNAKLLQLLTRDVRHDSSTRTITFTFPANYNPDLAKYHLTKNGNTYQIKQSADYDTSYAQGTVLINATGNIAKHHIDTTKSYKLSDTWHPNYDKLILAHKNANGTVSFNKVQLPKIPRYKTIVKTASSPVNHANALFAVSFMALSKPIAPAINDVKPTETVTPAATKVAKSIKTNPKAKISAVPKTIDLSDNAVTVTPTKSTWHVANDLEQNTYRISNDKYTVELPHINNTQLHVIANNSTKNSLLFTYKGQNSKYVFKIKFVNGHYFLTTYEIKSGKLVKLIDYNFVKSSKMINTILDWLKFK